MRIVTLLPGATEIVCLLGLGEKLVGVSHECDFPAFVQSLPRVTSALIPADATSRQIDEQVRQQLVSRQPLYSLDVDLLERLQPDLIITQNLCSVCAVSEHDLRQAAQRLAGSTKFLALEPRTLGDVLHSITEVAAVVDSVATATAVIAELQQQIEQVQQQTKQRDAIPSAVFLEWLDPPFSAGHWVPEIVRLAGANELLGQTGEPSRTITWDDVAAANPDVLILACCGYSADRTRQDLRLLESQSAWRNLRAVQSQKVIVMDGNAYFSRPGPRLVEGLKHLAASLAGL